MNVRDELADDMHLQGATPNDCFVLIPSQGLNGDDLQVIRVRLGDHAAIRTDFDKALEAEHSGNVRTVKIHIHQTDFGPFF